MAPTPALPPAKLRRRIGTLVEREQRKVSLLERLAAGELSPSEELRALRRLHTDSLDFAEGYQALATQIEVQRERASRRPAGARHGLARPARPARRRGRPARAELASKELTDAAPFAELVTVAADKLGPHVRAITDPGLLRAAHIFELAHSRRKTVLAAIEEQLRQLGAPLGGPAEPLAGYDSLSAERVIGALDQRAKDLEFAAQVFAYEHYHARRKRVLEAARRLAGKRGPALVAETSPRPLPLASEPFAGYDQLPATPQARVAVRAALAAQPQEVLQSALEYEQQTRNRVIMLAAIRSALRRLAE